MAAKKKSKAKPAQSKSKAKPAKKVKKAAKQVKKAVKKAAKKAAKTIAKAAKAAKPAKVEKKVAKAAKPAKAEKKVAKVAKVAKGEKKKSGGSSLLKTVQSAAAKVKQVAAAAVVKLMDSDAGKPAPSFDLTDEKGEHVSSESLAGKPYLLYFYPKDDTPGCTKEACDIRDNFGRFGQQGLRVLGVSPDSEQSHAKFGKKYGLPFTLLSDPDKTLASSYGVWGKKQNYGKEYMGIIRSSFLVGADGTIKKSYRGVKVDGHVDAILSDAQTLL
jgi:thioredoxin-dependent peroxiredoxin